MELVHTAVALQLWSSAPCAAPRELNVCFLLLHRSQRKILFNKEVMEQ